MSYIIGDEIHLSESPHIRWFEKLPKCSCGKTATGILRGTQNESYGHHCDRCASKRIKDSEKARAFLAEHKIPPEAA